MKIGLDIDGVLYPWHYSVYRYFTEFKGFEGDIDDFWTNHRQEITPYYITISPLYLDTTPTKDVLEYVPKIAELGEIYYITSRSPDLWWVTGKFFDNYNLPFKENLIFSKFKPTEVRLHRLDYFLDDQPKHVEELQGITNAYLFKCIHNRADRERFNTINTMKEFYELIKAGKNENGLQGIRG